MRSPHSTATLPTTRIATMISVPLAEGSGLGSFLLGLFGRLESRADFELMMIAPERERGAAGRRWSQVSLAIQQFVALIRARPGVIHVHDHPALLAAAVLYRMSVGSGARVVFSSHLDPAGARARWKRVMLGWLFARCSAVTVVCQDSAAKLALIAEPVPDSGRIRVVPGAAAPRLRAKSDPDVAAYAASIGHRGGPVLLQVSNFVYPAKVEGTLRLIEALAHVRMRIPDVRLILLGTGPLVGKARAECDRLGLTDAVTIPGTFVPDLSLPAGLADVHCHITGQDACPISILEAMHAGKPIVASRIGGIPEMLEEGLTGVLVSNDPQEIAGAVLNLLERPEEAKRLGTRAQVAARCRFTWDRVATDVESLYRGSPEPSGSALYVKAGSIGH